MDLNKSKIQLSKEEILNRYFKSYIDGEFVERYRQVNFDEQLSKIDALEVVYDFGGYQLNMFLGANCSNSERRFQHWLESLFLSGDRYEENESLLNFLLSIDSNEYLDIVSFFDEKVPNINLSDSDFSGREWDLSKFLKTIGGIVDKFLYILYGQRLRQIADDEELTFFQYGYIDSTDAYWEEEAKQIDREREQLRLKIISKLVPNLQNTNLRITIDMKELFGYEKIIDEILKSQKLDNCYIKLLNGESEFVNRLGFGPTINSEFGELYKFPNSSIDTEKKERLNIELEDKKCQNNQRVLKR